MLKKMRICKSTLPSVKRVFLEISQNSQENTCARVSILIKLLLKYKYTLKYTLLKQRLWHRCFPVDLAKFLRTPFLKNTSGDCFWISIDNARRLRKEATLPCGVF